MSETVHLALKANGNAIKGESTQTSLDRTDTIECYYYEQGVSSARDAATGMATGRRQYEPIVIRKRIDKSSPLLSKALSENQVVEGVFKFYRPNPTGDGTTEQFYSVQIKKGRISAMKQFLPDTTSDDTSHQHPMEEVSFVFGTISWTFTDGGVTHEDDWSSNR